MANRTPTKSLFRLYDMQINMDASPNSPASKTIERTLLPGSECLYLRLYSSVNNSDYLLRHIVSSFIESNKNTGVFEKWFFIRYGDPAWHVRLRFLGAPHSLLNAVLPYFATACKAALEAKRMYKLEIGTYTREIERYGGIMAMASAESLFEIDSETVLELLKLLPSNEYLPDRWKMAIVSTDELLNDFGLDVNGKRNLMTKLCKEFEAEFLTGGAFKESLSKRFRAKRAELTRLLTEKGEKTAIQSQAVKILALRSERNRALISTYKAALAGGDEGKRLDDIVGSIIHMHLNRLLRSAQRAQELVIYNFLLRLYRSMHARNDSGLSEPIQQPADMSQA